MDEPLGRAPGEPPEQLGVAAAMKAAQRRAKLLYRRAGVLRCGAWPHLSTRTVGLRNHLQ